jgi:superfamily II DNA/RNA helicase
LGFFYNKFQFLLLQDLIERNWLVLTEVEHCILDEADQMLDMGFQDEVDTIMKAVGLSKEKLQVIFVYL